MRKFLLLFAAIAVSAFAGSHVTPAYAQANRTWVSGAGSDSNDCSRPTPCATFTGAIAKTNAGGEINCLNSSDFGSVTITKAISIICHYVEAGVLVASTNGIIINAGPNDVVYLSGLDIEGAGTGLVGISYLAGKSLYVRHSIIRAFSGAGIQVNPSSGTNRLEVVDTIIDKNGGTGILVKPTGSGVAQATISDVHVANNGGDGIMGNANLTTGSVSVVVRNSTATQNNAAGFVAFSNNGKSDMMVHSSVAFRNNNGIAAAGSNGVVRFANSGVTANTTGISQASPNTALSYGNNSINGNTTDGTFGTVGLQ